MFVLSISSFITFLKTSIFLIGYITSSNLFPEPLTRRRRTNLFRKIFKWRYGGKKYFNREKFEISSTCM